MDPARAEAAEGSCRREGEKEAVLEHLPGLATVRLGLGASLSAEDLVVWAWFPGDLADSKQFRTMRPDRSLWFS